MADLIRQLAQNKLIILHLVQKMGISLSNSEICQFLLNNEYMDYFSAQQYLAELVDANWLEKTKEHNNTRYVITDDGEDVISYFKKYINDNVKDEIALYVKENSKRIRDEYAVTANYFPEHSGDYLVKCGLCDDSGMTLMQINVSVVSKQQAQQICKNWRKNVNHLYGTFLNALATNPESSSSSTKASPENFPNFTIDGINNASE